MSLLVADQALRSRAAVANSELAPLADSLTSELAPLVDRELYVPREKALLSREGGRCARDGSTLAFDPFSPRRHRCLTCGATYTGTLHDRFWVFWYQLWLAERAVHGALLGRLRGDVAARSLSARILERYCDQYLLYPNRDNVLGPTRPFFSTYLESIWLLNLCIAVDLLEGEEGDNARETTLSARVREKIVEPSAALIASYDEGASNRQVWNDAALIAAGRLLDRHDLVERGLHGPSGIDYHLLNGLLADGTWYEGENYHLFAHRGLWYGVTMAAVALEALSQNGLDRFQEGFATPFLTALPDMTLPSRRDSQYAISLRQARFAELCELGLARQSGEGDPRLRAMLRHLYQDDVPRGDTGRARTTADVERNLPPTALARADLGWRSLLFAKPRLPPLVGAPLGTVLLEAQGLAVFRRAQERIYVALDYGASGGGHGHPDRLNVLLSDGATRWLDDMGTGSYVDPSLHWYRSTLAHNAPRFAERDQLRVDGELLAFDDRGDMGWVSSRAIDLSPGVVTTRTLVIMQDYALDEVEWHADAPVVADLPFHIDPTMVAARDTASDDPPDRPLDSAELLNDPLGVLHDVSAQRISARVPVHLTARDGPRELESFIVPSASAFIYRATAPGPPGAGQKPFIILRVPTAGDPGWVRTIWSWAGAVESVSLDANTRITTVERRDGSRDEHRRSVRGWHIEHIVGEQRHAVQFGGLVHRPRQDSARPFKSRPDALELDAARPLIFDLGADQYRRSEESWDEAGRPTARVELRYIPSAGSAPNELRVGIDIRKAEPLTFAAEDAVNPYDNESPDINGDGVQLYIADAFEATGQVLIPVAGSKGEVRARLIDEWTSTRPISAVWHPTRNGWALQATIPFTPCPGAPPEFGLGIVVNEKPPGRDRRRGQLVLGGTPGGFVYLRGDREDRERLPRFRIAD